MMKHPNETRQPEPAASAAKTRRAHKKPLGWFALGGVLLLGVLLFAMTRFSLEISLRGDPNVVVEYGDSYADPGVEASLTGTLFSRSDGEPPVDISNPVDTQKLGAYQVTYTVRHLWRSRSVERTVQVVDTTPPVIELVSSPDTYTLPGESYQEEGFTVTDNYDGDLTAQVVREEKDGIVTYQVQDSSGNSAVVERKIVYHDPVPPVLTLKGDTQITLTAGSSFSDPGYRATDNYDGDLTGKVKVSGLPDTYRAGTYKVEYTVEDSFGNKATATRTVTVNPLRQPNVISPAGKVIYLTFDDGPGAYTGRLLDVLKKYNVKATFFVLDNGNYNTLRRIANEGHSLGIHSATHNYKKIYASEEAYFNDLNTVRNTIRRETGVDTTLVRFPGGSSNKVSSFNKGIMTRLTKAVTDMGYQYFDWNVDSRDAGGVSTADGVFKNVVNGIQGKTTAVVLQHDIKSYSVDAVERIITWGLANGYAFLPLKANSPVCHHRVNN